jgi:hypothetical protein
MSAAIRIRQDFEAVTLRRLATTVKDAGACPVRAVRAWLEASNITTGPLFRPIGKGGRISTDRLADHTVVRVVKASARRVGLDPKLFAGHSLRSGFLDAPLELPRRGGRSPKGSFAPGPRPSHTGRPEIATLHAAPIEPRRRLEPGTCSACTGLRSTAGSTTPCRCRSWSSCRCV